MNHDDFITKQDRNRLIGAGCALMAIHIAFWAVLGACLAVVVKLVFF